MGAAARCRSVVAVDLGAESGRVVVGRFDGRRLTVQEVHRFPNEPVRVVGRLQWDVLRLWLEIQRGLARARAACAGNDSLPEAVGVDTWGVDFALLGEDGDLLGNPRHYRDMASESAMRGLLERLPARRLFELTGIQTMPINTVFQLANLRTVAPATFRHARRLLMLPGLFTYLLAGTKVDEWTSASTSQLCAARTRRWAWEVVDALELPRYLLGEVVPPGTPAGPLLESVVAETGLHGAQAVLTAGHDTACAVAAVPATGAGWAYISSGTWSLVGVEVADPVITDAAFAANVGNEGGVGGTYRLLRNVMGLWLVQECRRQWEREGVSLDYETLARAAASVESGRCFIDPDDPRFLQPGDIPSRVRAFCEETDQPRPAGRAELLRVIFESLALKYRLVVERLESVTGTSIDRIHVVGGGARNELLCQLTADVTGRPVVAGPPEATAVGNVLVQLHALAEVNGLKEMREVVRASFDTRVFLPRRMDEWEETYHRFERLVESRTAASLTA